MKERKQELRKEILQQRRTLPISEWQTKSQQICHHLQAHSSFRKAKTVLAYFSFRQEPDLSYLFNGKLWGFPRCEGNSLVWYYWHPPQLLKANKYNIDEPLVTAVIVKPQEVDLILVPTVACDRFGSRLGYGGGYYDRCLSNSLWRNIPTIGITFDFAYLKQLPTEPWDIKLDYICTESTIDRQLTSKD